MTSPSTTYPGITRTAVLAAPLLLLAVTGVLVETGGRSSAPVTAPSPGLTTAAEQTYLNTARSSGVTGSDEAVLTTARNACALLSSGGVGGRVAHYVALSGGIDDDAGRVVLRAAVAATCPAQELRAA